MALRRGDLVFRDLRQCLHYLLDGIQLLVWFLAGGKMELCDIGSTTCAVGPRGATSEVADRKSNDEGEVDE
jgi:hypothetical protein